MWIDSHCHLDAPEFDADRDAVRQAARQAGVSICVIPAVERANFAVVKELAHRYNDVYALGIHPLYVPLATQDDLAILDKTIGQALNDQSLVAIGEIGLDYFVPDLCTPEMREKQWHFYVEQLKIARRYHLPVILHVRQSADLLLKGLRQIGFERGGVGYTGGIVHAFNGSFQQAQAFINFGFKLGFGATLTYKRSLQIRRLATDLPLESIVLETDAPNSAPQWLYVRSESRALGQIMPRNKPIELPKIGSVLAELRGVSGQEIAHQTTQNIKNLFNRFFLN